MKKKANGWATVFKIINVTLVAIIRNCNSGWDPLLLQNANKNTVLVLCKSQHLRNADRYANLFCPPPPLLYFCTTLKRKKK